MDSTLGTFRWLCLLIPLSACTGQVRGPGDAGAAHGDGPAAPDTRTHSPDAGETSTRAGRDGEGGAAVSDTGGAGAGGSHSQAAESGTMSTDSPDSAGQGSPNSDTPNAPETLVSTPPDLSVVSK